MEFEMLAQHGAYLIQVRIQEFKIRKLPILFAQIAVDVFDLQLPRLLQNNRTQQRIVKLAIKFNWYTRSPSQTASRSLSGLM